MKLWKLSLIVITLVFLLSLTGCYDSNWQFNFKGATLDQLDAFTQLPMYFTVNLFSMNPTIQGLELDNQAIFGPYGFLGDMKLTLKFDLLASADFTADIAVALSSSASYAPDDEVKVELRGLGDAEASKFFVYDTGESSSSIPTSKPRVNISGGNTLEIIKSGDNFTIKLNGSKIADFTAVNCSSTQQLFPGFGAYLDGGKVTFTSIRVDYNK